MTNPTQAALLDALTTGRKYVELQNRAEGMFEGFGGRKPRPSDDDLAAIDRAISLLSAANTEPSNVASQKPAEMADKHICHQSIAANAHPVQAEQTARVGEVTGIAEAIDTAKQVIEELTSTHISAAIVGEKCPTRDYITNYEHVIRARQFLEYTLLPMLEQFSTPAAHTAQSADNQLSASAGAGQQEE